MVDDDLLVRSYRVHPSLRAVGPAYQEVGNRCASQAEMYFEWVMRVEVVMPAHFAHLSALFGRDRNPCPDAQMVPSGAPSLNREIVIIVLRLVPIENQAEGADVRNHDVDIAVALGIEASNAPALPRVFKAQFLGTFSKDAETAVVEEANRFKPIILVPKRQPTSDMENVEIGVVIEIGRTAPPAQPPSSTFAAAVKSSNTPDPSLR